MRYSHYSFSRYLIIGISAVAILMVATVSFFVLRHGPRTAAASVTPPAKVLSDFSFAATTDWSQGATNQTSMAVFHAAHDCFISAQYQTGIVDPAAALQKINAQLTSSGYAVTPGTTQSLTLQTKTGTQTYTLSQSMVTSPSGASQVEGGQEFGYVQLTKGYIKVEGYCDTAAELPATIPALQAVRFGTE